MFTYKYTHLYLFRELLNLGANFNGTRWGQDTEESSNCFLKIGGCWKESSDYIFSTEGKEQKSTLNSEEFTQWRNFKKKCSWRLIFIDKQNSPTFMWNPSSFIQVCKHCSVCNTWVLQIQSALAHASFLSFNIECCKKFSDFFKVG